MKTIEELKKLLDDPRTGLKDSSDTNKTRSQILAMFTDIQREMIEEIEQWKQDEFEPLYREITLGGIPQQKLDSKGDRWIKYQDLIVDFAEEAQKELDKLIDSLQSPVKEEECNHVPQQKQVTDNGHTYWVNGDVCEKCGALL